MGLLVAKALKNGWSQDELARRIQRQVGLDARYAQAVDNYRDGLLAQGIAKGKAEQAANGYARRLRVSRAQRIAQYEVHKALQDAQRAVWAQDRAAGVMGPDKVRVWRVHKDEKRCADCRPMNGQRATLRPNGKGYVMKRSGQQVVGPPVHPNCRCYEELVERGPVIKSGEEHLWEPEPEPVSKHLPGRHDQSRHGRKGDHQAALGGVAWAFAGESERMTAAAAGVLKDPGNFYADENEHSSSIRSVLNFINKQPRYKRTLYSGHGQPLKWASNLKPGTKIVFPLLATSTKRNLAGAYAGEGASVRWPKQMKDALAELDAAEDQEQAQKTRAFLLDLLKRDYYTSGVGPVVYEFQPGGRSAYYRENERLLSGDWEVVGTRKVPVEDSDPLWDVDAQDWVQPYSVVVTMKYVGPSEQTPPEDDVDPKHWDDWDDYEDVEKSRLGAGFRHKGLMGKWGGPTIAS